MSVGFFDNNFKNRNWFNRMASDLIVNFNWFYCIFVQIVDCATALYCIVYRYTANSIQNITISKNIFKRFKFQDKLTFFLVQNSSFLMMVYYSQYWNPYNYIIDEFETHFHVKYTYSLWFFWTFWKCFQAHLRTHNICNNRITLI